MIDGINIFRRFQAAAIIFRIRVAFILFYADGLLVRGILPINYSYNIQNFFLIPGNRLIFYILFNRDRAAII